MKKGIQTIINMFLGGVAGAGVVFKLEDSKIRQKDELNNKNDAILKLYNYWMNLSLKGKTVSGYLKEHGYHSVAIYGMHYLGDNLLNELTDNGVEVKYAVDRNAERIQADVEVVKPEDELLEVDVIIVTAIRFFEEIDATLAKRVDCPILSIEDILYDM